MLRDEYSPEDIDALNRIPRSNIHCSLAKVLLDFLRDECNDDKIFLTYAEVFKRAGYESLVHATAYYLGGLSHFLPHTRLANDFSGNAWGELPKHRSRKAL